MLAAQPLLRRLLLPCLLLPIVPVSTVLVNMTIDDTDGDPIGGSSLTLSPSGQWTPGQTCPACSVHSGNTSSTVNVSQVFSGTWHQSIFVPNVPGDPNNIVNVDFTGSAVYVYNIIANAIPSATTLTQVNFFIDNDLVGNYEHVPQNTGPTFEYGVLVYANASIPYGAHNFIMSAQGPNTSLILFDYMMYTQDRPDSTSSSLDGSGGPTGSVSSPGSASSLRASSTSVSGSNKSSRPPVGAIVGGIVGGVVGLAIIALLVLLFLRARARGQGAARIPSPGAEMESRADPFVRVVSHGGGAQRQGQPGERQTAGHRDRERPSPRLPAPRMSPAEAAAYTSRLAALEAHVRALEAQQPGPGPSTTSESGTRSYVSSWLTRSRSSRSRLGHTRSALGSLRSPGPGTSNVNGASASGSGSASAADSGWELQEELASLRSEIAALRGVLAQDQLQFPGGLSDVGPAPSYVS